MVLRSVTHTKQRLKHAQTAGELGGTKGTTRQPPKDHKRDENAINLACCGIWDVRSMWVGAMATEALRGSFRLRARARPFSCSALRCKQQGNSYTLGGTKGTTRYSRQKTTKEETKIR